MRDGALARKSLDDLGLALGAPAVPRRLVETLYRSTDPYEVGVAASFSMASPPRALVYYNPRKRGAAFVRRVHATFLAHGLEPSWLGALSEAIPLSRVSTIAGFDVDASGVPSGTLYFEELSERLGDHASGLLSDVAKQLRLSAGEDPRARVGAPYILAVDFTRRGPERLKVYTFAQPAERGAARDEAAAISPELSHDGSPAAEVLFGDGACSGYIIQRAYDVDRLVRHKVYRCLPYEQQPTDGAGQQALQTLGIEDRTGVAAALLQPSFGTTSVGIAFAPGRDAPEYVSVYQCLLRGDRVATGRS